MGKIVKFIAAAAFIVAGVLTGNVGLILAGVSIGSSGLAKKPSSPKVSPESIERLNASIDPRTPRKMVFGSTAMATDIRDQEYTESQKYLHRFIVVAAHKVNQIQQIWFDNKLAWTLSGGVQGEFVGYLTVTPVLEGNAGNAINISSRMGSTRRFTGCAYVHLRYQLTGNDKKTNGPFASGVASRMTIIGDGAFCYDPRKDSTVPGGSGTHRADNQTTWEWDTNACRNPAIQMLWYLLGWKINGKLSVGKGILPARIDLESFAIAANICDEAVARVTGGPEPRYRSHGVFGEGDNPTAVLDALKACMNAELDDVIGKIRLSVIHDDLGVSVAFGDDDVLDQFEWIPYPTADEGFNVVRGIYSDPSETSLYQPVDYPAWEVASPDGIERTLPFDLANLQSVTQAQRLAKLKAMRQKYSGTFQATFNITGWRVQKNMVVRLTFKARGWVNKLFRVVEMEHRVDGSVPMLLREENSAIYAWSTADEKAVSPNVAASNYDPLLNPATQDISVASVSVIPPSEQIIFVDDVGSPYTDQYPRTLQVEVFSSGVNITTGNNVSYSIAPSGVTATIDNTTASATKGLITATAGDAGFINIMVTVDGVPNGPYRVNFTPYAPTPEFIDGGSL